MDRRAEGYQKQSSGDTSTMEKNSVHGQRVNVKSSLVVDYWIFAELFD
jgi:hypothetical protein